MSGVKTGSEETRQVILEAGGKTLDLERVVARLAVIKMAVGHEYELSTLNIGRPVISTTELRGLYESVSSVYCTVAEYLYGSSGSPENPQY